MDWKRTKSIFILTFLVLNLFLGYQLYQKNDLNNIATLSEQPLEERLAINKIEYKDQIPQYKEQQTMISAQRYGFTAEEQLKPTSKEIKQNKENSTDITLSYSFKKPLALTDKDKNDVIDKLDDFVLKNVSRGKDYTFYEWDKENNVIYYTQDYLEKPIFYDITNFEKQDELTKDFKAPNGMIKFSLDDKGNVTGYTQTYLLIMRQGSFQKIISPMKAIERLFNAGLFSKGEHVTEIKLGYYSLVGVGDLQVYAPTWYIKTKDGQYLVNALDSSIQDISKKE